MTVTVTRHAIDRYQERVANVAEDRAIAALTCPAVQVADTFGASVVRLGTGQRILLRNHAVITVLPAFPAGTIPRCFYRTDERTSARISMEPIQ